MHNKLRDVEKQIEELESERNDYIKFPDCDDVSWEQAYPNDAAKLKFLRTCASLTNLDKDGA